MWILNKIMWLNGTVLYLGKVMHILNTKTVNLLENQGTFEVTIINFVLRSFGETINVFGVVVLLITI